MSVPYSRQIAARASRSSSMSACTTSPGPCGVCHDHSAHSSRSAKVMFGRLRPPRHADRRLSGLRQTRRRSGRSNFEMLSATLRRQPHDLRGPNAARPHSSRITRAITFMAGPKTTGRLHRRHSQLSRRKTASFSSGVRSLLSMAAPIDRDTRYVYPVGHPGQNPPSNTSAAVHGHALGKVDAASPASATASSAASR